MDKGTIIYVGPYSFPNGGAAARRILGNCFSLRAAGYEVIISSGQMKSSASVTEYEGFPLVSLNERCYEKYPHLLKHFLYLGMGKKTVQWLDSLEKKPLALILYSGYSPYLIRLRKWCKKNSVKLVFDAVEWYEPPSLLARFFSPYHLNIELAMNYLSPKVMNVICISQFLSKYYSSKGCNTINVPPTLDHQHVISNLSPVNNGVLKLVYTGVPGKKDLLDKVLQAVIQLNLEGNRVELHLAGDCSLLVSKYSEYLNECVFDHGFLPHNKALDLVRESDFSVLFRPDQRSSHAGFSTKFVESLSVGTPVIGNITSDLALHLINEKTGIVCDEVTLEKVKEKIKFALSLDRDALEKMRMISRKHSENHFDYRVYSGLYSRFIKNLIFSFDLERIGNE